MATQDNANDPSDSEKQEEQKNDYPPSFKCWQYGAIGMIYILWIILALFVVDQVFFCYTFKFPQGIYIAGGLFLGSLFLERLWRFPIAAHEVRREDISEVQSLIRQAETVRTWMRPDAKDNQNWDDRIDDLVNTANKIGNFEYEYWTEYFVLPLRQKLVDFLKVDDLRSQAQSILGDLQEYAEDSNYRYDKEHYGKWNERISVADKKIEERIVMRERGAGEFDPESTEPLRAELRTVLSHVAAYQAVWAQGSSLLRSLYICGAASVVVFAFLGLAPVLVPTISDTLDIHNWASLAIVGSITAVLRAFRNSDVAEVGNTEGKKEIWRAILGAILGLVAGLVIFGLIGGALIDGVATPNLDYKDMKDVPLTIVWGIGAGYSFERVFDQLRRTTGGGS